MTSRVLLEGGGGFVREGVFGSGVGFSLCAAGVSCSFGDKFTGTELGGKGSGWRASGRSGPTRSPPPTVGSLVVCCEQEVVILLRSMIFAVCVERLRPIAFFRVVCARIRSLRFPVGGV